MAATTLSNAFSAGDNSTAIIVPSKPQALAISYKQLSAEVLSFQKKLAKLGVTPQAAVSIALPNTYEFIVAFLAAAWQRGIAAPLNAAYKQEEFEFYIDDLKSAVALCAKRLLCTRWSCRSSSEEIQSCNCRMLLERTRSM